VKGMFLFLLALFLGACAAAENSANSAIVVREAWVREPPGDHPITAAYMLIENSSSEPVVLTGVDCAVAERVEIHLMQLKDGKMSMRQVDELPVPAGGSALLKPGGLHLMLMGMQEAPKAGQELELRLHFADGGQKTVLAMVRRGSYAD